jgi:lipoate-protein ligase A
MKNLLKYSKRGFTNFLKDANIYIAKSNNIVFNLSTEEFFYEHQNIDKPVLFLYQNDKNVVIGKHQNPWKECHITLMEQENINLARRRSGGGAVYQDLGNLVFSFLLPHDAGVDFKGINTNILLNAFKSLGIDAHFSGRNDILVEDKKV